MLKHIKKPTYRVFLRKKMRNRFALKTANKAVKPRLSVFKSKQHIYAQIIDDKKAVTLVSASTLNKNIAKGLDGKTCNINAAAIIGKNIAEDALKLNITEVVFDRGGYIFHGKVKALADKAREYGLKF